MISNFTVLYAASTRPPTYFTSISEASVFSVPLPKPIVNRKRACHHRPIAGTTRRNGDKKIDAELTANLLADPKENAEHVMLVDLARNDLSRNCKDVQVEFYKEPQYYSHVIHLVSRVSGELNPNANSIKTFIDTFPAGT